MGLRCGLERVRVFVGGLALFFQLTPADANFRLVMNGPIGVKEIERLIQKLELDKEILADFRRRK